MRQLNSLIITTADKTSVPAGKALAVDRDLFSAGITEQLAAHPLVTIVRREIREIPGDSDGLTIIASGPLSSDSLAESLAGLTGKQRLFFYDAIAPILYADSLDMNVIYQKSRYDDGPGDYLNCPMDRIAYERFINELSSADYTPLHDFEEAKYFEGCLPIEIMRSRGDETLRYGPMKPVGLEKSAYRGNPLCRRPAEKGKQPGDILQHGWFPDQTYLSRTATDLHNDPRP